MQLKRAENLLEIRNTLLAGHLTGADQLRAFYRKELQELRGPDMVTFLARNLREDSAATPRRSFRHFVSGHPGVGKSTELSRLEQRVTGEFEIVRLNAQLELNPARFDPRDVIVVLMKAAIERTVRQLGNNKAPGQASDAIAAALTLLGKTKTAKKTIKKTAVGAKAGIGPSAESIWAKALGVFGHAQGEARYETESEDSHIQYRLKPVAELLEHANAVFAACESACAAHASDGNTGQFFFIIDNFEKPDFDSGSIRKLFVQNSPLLADLQIHYVFTMPIERANTEDIHRLQLYDNHIKIIPDAPLFERDYRPHLAGRKALEAVLTSRVAPELFADGQIERLIVASGGNLRDLFALVLSARDHALNTNEHAKRLEAIHVTPAIDEMRAAYHRKLYGDDEAVEGKATYNERLQLLTAFFLQKPAADRGAAFYSLLRARALQEFDDARIGVHPLIVDLLYQAGLLTDLPANQIDSATQRPLRRRHPPREQWRGWSGRSHVRRAPLRPLSSSWNTPTSCSAPMLCNASAKRSRPTKSPSTRSFSTPPLPTATMRRCAI
jgi:hypothetical protein